MVKSFPTVIEVILWLERSEISAKRTEEIMFCFLLFMRTMAHTSDIQKEAVFCMLLRLVDIISELILISLLKLTKHFSFVKLQDSKSFIDFCIHNSGWAHE